jgi:hypothetical protein
MRLQEHPVTNIIGICSGRYQMKWMRHCMSSNGENYLCLLPFPPTATGSLQSYRIAIKRSPKQRIAHTSMTLQRDQEILAGNWYACFVTIKQGKDCK